MRYNLIIRILTVAILLYACQSRLAADDRTPVDYVNPYMGNTSHMLQPTFPVVHLPNGMLKVRPERADYVTDRIDGLGMAMPSYISSSFYRLSPWKESAGAVPDDVISYIWDNEKVTPYSYRVNLMDPDIDVSFAPSYKAGIYEIDYNSSDGKLLVVDAAEGELKPSGEGAITGKVDVGNGTVQFVYIETDTEYRLKRKDKGTVILMFVSGTDKVNLRYGISYVSASQAKANLRSSIGKSDIGDVMAAGKDEWNSALSGILVEGGSEDEKSVLYTSLYRTYNRMIDISEDGLYYSAFDSKVHKDDGISFYTDDWFWDNYKCVHPLRTIIDSEKEKQMIVSMLRMAEQSEHGWLPTFPSVRGDDHRMNGNHGMIILADAMVKGLVSREDAEKALEISKRTFFEETHAPWVKGPAGEYDRFYHENGYFPGLKPGEKEKYEGIHDWERRQSVAVSLAASYDAWAIAVMADWLGHEEDEKRFMSISRNYRLLFNEETGFFHPKGEDGEFIEPFDYKFSGGMGARDYYDENNAWTYRWDLQHDIPGLISLLGGNEATEDSLDRLFREELGAIRWDFWDQFPDHTGIVGQFSMGNEPSMHIPYLYNYTGSPWKTQKRVRDLMDQWFRNDLMGVPGDEDGGGLSAFAVFSSIGIYPVTPGVPVYTIGSPLFSHVVLTTDEGKRFEIIADGCSKENKYIQSAMLDGEPLPGPWIRHQDIVNGGSLILKMADKPAREWNAGVSADETAPFIHPGIDMTMADLEYMKSKVLAGEEPWATAYRNLENSVPSTYVDMKGPDLFATSDEPRPDNSLKAVSHVIGGAYNNPDIGATAILEAADAAYDYALLWYIGGDEKYAERSRAILMDWSSVLRSLDDNNAKLLVALSGYQFCNAAEILRYCWKGWSESDTACLTRMLKQVFYPYLRFYFPEANGNWDGAIMHSLMAMAVFTDSREIFDDAVSHYQFATGNGSLFKYIYPSGQCQETPRDQAHVQMGLAEFGGAARIAYTQGVDLFSLGDFRLALGLEYTAKFLLGEPSFVYGIQSPRRTDELREDFEYFYRLYSYLGVDTPYLKALCDKVRSDADRGVLTGFRPEFLTGDSAGAIKLGPKDIAYPAGAVEVSGKFHQSCIEVAPGDDIQAAIDSAGNRTVLLKAGMHSILEPLLIRSGTRLAGEGAETVIMTFGCASHYALRNATDDMTDVVLSDFIIEGAKDHDEDPDPNGGRFNRTMRYSNNRSGIHFAASSDGLLRDILLKNISVINFSKNGIKISGAENVKLESCNISDNGSAIIPGPKLQHNLNMSHVRNAEIDGCRFDTSLAGCGISMICCENVTVNDCEVARNAWHGIYAGDCGMVSVANCLIEANDGSGMMLENLASVSENISVTGNIVWFNSGYGICMMSGKGNMLLGNRLENNRNGHICN